MKLKPAPHDGQPAKVQSSGGPGVAPAREVSLSVYDVNLPGLAGQRVYLCASVVSEDCVAHNLPSALRDVVPQFTSPAKTGSGVLTVMDETLSFTHRVLGSGAQGALEPLDGKPVQILLTLHASAQPAPALAQALVPATMGSSVQEHEFPLVDMNFRPIFFPSDPPVKTEGQVLMMRAPTKKEGLKEAFADYVAQEKDELRCQLACVSAGRLLSAVSQESCQCLAGQSCILLSAHASRCDAMVGSSLMATMRMAIRASLTRTLCCYALGCYCSFKRGDQIQILGDSEDPVKLRLQTCGQTDRPLLTPSSLLGG